MKDKKDVLVVVLSRNYSTGLSVIRSLGSAGYTVDLVASAHKEGNSVIAAKSKYVRNSVEIVSKKVKDGGDVELMDALLAYKGTTEDKPVLFPTDDYTTSIMDLNRSKLEEIFIMPHIVGGGNGSIMKRMDKTVQGTMARSVGLLTPKEWVISLKDDIEIPEDMVYPCFVKPLESVTGYKSEMAACEDKDSLESHLYKLRRKYSNRSILVQEFLNIDYEIDLSGVALDDKIIIPAIIKKTNVAQHEKGVTLAGRVVPYEEMSEEVREKTDALLRKFRYFGMFDMEFNVVGDKVYFNELNLRSGGPNYSYFASGVNLPALFVEEAIGNGHTEEDEKVAEYGKSFIYDKVAWDDYIYGFMTKKELEESLAKADVTLLANEDDPVPGQIFEKQIKRKYVRHILGEQKRAVRRAVKTNVYPVLRPVKHTILGYPQTKKANRRDPNAEKPRVLVAGRNYCSNLCMARSLGEAGYEVEVMRVFQKRPKKLNIIKALKPDAYSKYIKAYYVCVSQRRSKRIRNHLIRHADPDRKMLLVPCDDLVAEIADRFYEELSPYFIMPNVNDTPGEIGRLMSKGVQKELAKEFGLPVLNSCVIATKDGHFTIPASVTYPCFIKPNISKNSSKGKMRKCDSEAELKEVLTEYGARKNVEMLVEDFVEIKHEYSILGLSTKEGAVGPGFFIAEEGGHAEHRGVAITGRMLPCSVQQELIDQMNAFVGTLNFEGLYDIDLIETMDGKIYFVEVNMRYGASGYALTKCGVNLPGMFADHMIFGTPVDLTVQPTVTDKVFVSEKVLIEEYMMGRIPFSMVTETIDNVDIHFIKNDEDPQAFKHFKKFYPVAKLMRKYNEMEAKKAEDQEENDSDQ